MTILSSRTSQLASRGRLTPSRTQDLGSSLFGRFLVFAFIVSSLSLTGIPGLARINDVVAIGLIFYAAMSAPKYGTRLPAWVLAPVTFLLVSLAGALANPVSGLSTYITILPVWLGGIAMAFVVKDRESEDAALAGMVLAAAANSAAVLIGFDSFATYNPLAQSVSAVDLQNRASGLVGNANVYAVQACLTSLAVIVLRPQAGKKVLLFVWVLSLHATVASGSRKGFILFALLTVYLLLARYFEKEITVSRFLALVTIMLTIAAVSVPILSSKVYLAFGDVFTIERVSRALSGEDTSFLERQFLFREAVQLFFQSPVFGHGFDSFRNLSRLGLYSHVNFLELAVSGGLVLVFSFYAIYVVALTRLREKYRSSRYVPRIWLLALSLFVVEASSVTYSLEVIPILLMLISTNPKIGDIARPLRLSQADS